MTSIEPKNEEREFKIEQLFYSRTDERGVILSGNWVFQRISGYSWEELLGAPHKLVRHPDMPKGVFWLLWDTIKSGKPIAAYVKNLAKDGTYYWVLANLTPMEGGYFSVRVKPTSTLFPKVVDIYEDLLAEERTGGVTPEQSAQSFLGQLHDLGFQDYDEFSAYALNSEVACRAEAIHGPGEADLKRYHAIAEAVRNVEDSVGEVVQTFSTIRLVPSNMRIIATRLEPTGGPISTIAVNYSIMARDMEAWVQSFLDSSESGFAQMRRATSRALYLTSAARMQREGASSLLSERRGSQHNDHTVERELLDTLADQYEAEALKALTALAASARRLARDQLEMKRYVTGLASTRTLCRVENARLGDAGGSLDGIVESLDEFQNDIDSHLTLIGEQIRLIQSQIEVLLTRRVETGSQSTSLGLKSHVRNGAGKPEGARTEAA